MKPPRTASMDAKAAKAIAASDFAVRALAAALLIPMALVAEWLGSWIFAGFAAICGALIVAEFLRMAIGGRRTMLLGAAVPGMFAIAFAALWLALLPAIVVLLGVALGLGLLARSGADRRHDRIYAALSVVYAGAPVIALVMLRHDEVHGLGAVLWLLCVVWASDTGAYLAGRAIGGPKLWPRVSPKKTWAGLAGGVLAAAAVGVVASQWIADTQTEALVVLAMVLGLVAQAGDLLESSMKRHFNVKDSGTLIPGHGGAMDRLDGVVTAAVAAGFVGLWRGGELAAGTGLLVW